MANVQRLWAGDRHDARDASEPRLHPLPQVCQFYLAGKCSYGSKCRFDHVKPRQPAPARQQPPPVARVAAQPASNHQASPQEIPQPQQHARPVSWAAAAAGGESAAGRAPGGGATRSLPSGGADECGVDSGGGGRASVAAAAEPRGEAAWVAAAVARAARVAAAAAAAAAAAERAEEERGGAPPERPEDVECGICLVRRPPPAARSAAAPWLQAYP